MPRSIVSGSERFSLTLSLIAFLAISAVPSPASAAQPAVGVLGQAPAAALSSLLSQRDDLVRPLRDVAALSGTDLLVVGDATLSSYSRADLDVLTQAVTGSTPVVVAGSGDALRRFVHAAGSVRPSNDGAIALYAFRRLPNGVGADFYLLRAGTGSTRQEASRSAPLRTQAPAPVTGAAAQQPEVSTPTDPLAALRDWLREGSTHVGDASDWDAAFNTRWADASNASRYIVTWDFSVSKLGDIRSGQDFYAVNVKPASQIVAYGASYTYGVGWYVEDASTRLAFAAHDAPGTRTSTLLEYQPTGTVSGSSVAWTIGGSVGTDAIGINAQYGQSFNMSDVTMHDQSSLYYAISQWQSTYAGPSYVWYPVSMTEPCQNAHSSHYTQLAAIVSISSDPALVTPPGVGVAADVQVGFDISWDHNFRLPFPFLTLYWDHSTYSPAQSGTINVYYNRPPTITQFNPSNSVVDVNAGFGVNFDATAQDRDGTVPTLTWYLDEVLQRTAAQWAYHPGNPDVGSHLVRVVASDGAAQDDQIWTVNVHPSGTAVPGGALPSALEMSAPYPNPCSQRARFDLGLPRPADVRVSVLDASGARVRTLLDRSMEAGRFSVIWDGRDEQGLRAPDGLYFCRIVAGGESLVRRVALTH